MLLLSKESKLPPVAVLDRASSFFGEEGLGLDVVERSETCITFSGGGGYVTVKCKDQGSSFFDIEVETREWDYHVKEFLSNI